MNDHYDPFARAELEQLRVPPQSIESEQAVLGGLMLAPGAFERIIDIVKPDDFYRHDHQLIYRAIQELSEKNRPYDAVTIGEWFDARGIAEQVGGGGYLIELASTTPSAANIKAYAEIVRDKAQLRRAIDVGTALVNDGFRPEGRATSEIIASAERAVMQLSTGVIGTVSDGMDGLRAAAAEMTRRRRMGVNDLLGVPTGLDYLDELTMGMQPTDLIILAARPSMGKTAKMLQMMRVAALYGHRPYGISIEMSREQIFMRHICALSRVDFGHVQRTARATPQEMDRIKAAMVKMRDMQWWLDDAPGMTPQLAVSRIRRMKAEHNIGIAFIDYLQYMDISYYLMKGLNVTTAIQEVTRLLKATAKELKIPIVLLSQLNRALESRSDKRPIMADLRESGAIEQDADVVKFIHRQGYYERDWPNDDPRKNVCEIIVAKARNGQTGICNATWLGRYQTFENLSYNNLPANYSTDPRKEKSKGFEPVVRTGLVSTVNQEDEE